MSFLHLWPIYLGALAAGLPLAVHWLTRPRPRKMPLSTLRFVREMAEQRRARNRLRDFIILALRVAAVLLLAWAVARPLLRTRAAEVPGEVGNVARVVLLDVSQSMAASQGGIEAFERARARAAEHFAYERGLRANLIRAGATARPAFDHLSNNQGALRDELARTRVLPQRLNVQPALALAAQIFADESSETSLREFVVISDFQRTSWANADFSVLPADTKIELESVSPADPLENMAVLEVTVDGHPVQGKQSRLQVEVGNFSPTPHRAVCDVALGDLSYRLEGVCPANGKVTLSQDVVLDSTGWKTGRARFVDQLDALAVDDSRDFALNVHVPAPLALITRQRPDDVRASSFYLERALAPYPPGQHADSQRVQRIDPAAVDADTLAAAELVILDHPGKLSDEMIGLLAGLLRRGRAVWYLVAEPSDAVNLKQMTQSVGSALQMPVEFSPPQSGHPRRDLFWSELKDDQAPFAIFGDSLKKATAALRFAGGLASTRIAGGLADDLVAQYGDHSAALVICASGAGTLAVWNADLGRSNLPASPVFVPLVDELVDRLLGDRKRSSPVFSGEPTAVYLPADVHTAAGLKIDTGAAADPPAPGELVDEAQGVVWRMASAVPPGIYRVERGGQTVFALASELPPEESDLRNLTPDVLKDRMSGGRQMQYRSVDERDNVDDLWTWLAVGTTVAMLIELLVLRIFRV
ncbi:MAG TPA: BatA domain-containing protein [Pirellulales bacterium]